MLSYEQIARKVCQYKYSLDVRILYPDNKVEQIAEDNVVSLSVEHDFEQNLYPITKLQISVSERSYYKIIENKDDIEFELRLKCTSTDDSEDLEGDKNTFFNNIISTKLKPIMDKITPYKTKNLDSSDLEEDERTDINVKDTNEFNVMTFYLFKEKDLNMNKSLFNFIAEDVDILSVIGYLVNTMEVENLLISPPDNKNIYSQIIVPTGNYKETMNHLQVYYGIYKNGLKTYFDFDKSYILSKDINLSPYSENEPEIIYIYINSIEEFESMGYYGMVYDRSTRNEYICTPNYTQFKTHTQKTSEILGNEISILDQNKMENDAVLYDPNTGKYNFSELKVTMNKGDKDSKNNRQTIFTNNLSNDFINNEFEYQLDKSNLEIILPLADINIKHFNPNRKFILMFREQELSYKYSGEYFLDKINYNLSKNNGNYLSVYAQCLFKKI